MNIRKLHITSMLALLFLLGMSVEFVPFCLHATIHGEQACSCQKSPSEGLDSNQVSAGVHSSIQSSSDHSCCSTPSANVFRTIQMVRSVDYISSGSFQLINVHYEHPAFNSANRTLSVQGRISIPPDATPPTFVRNCTWLC